MKTKLFCFFLIAGIGNIYAQGTIIGNAANADVSIYSNNLVRITVKNTGLTGIGTNAPTELLDVNGTARLRTVTQNDTYTRVLVTDTNGKIFWRNSPTFGDNLGNHIATQSILPGTTNVYDLGSTSNTFRNLYLGGNLGIGTTAPTELLDVAGTARFRTVTQDDSQPRVLVSDTNGKVFWRDAATLTSGTGTLSFVQLPNTTIGVGSGALINNSTTASQGTMNSGFGTNSLQLNTTGNGNSGFGFYTLQQNTTGIGNVGIGAYSLQNNTTGTYNTAVGATASAHTLTGSYNSALGYNAGTSADISNSTAIGAFSVVNVNYGIVLGTSQNFVGIRQNSPAYALHVQNAYCDGNTWFNASDKNLKENFRTLAGENILEKVMQLKIERWNYIGENTGVTHIGPTAQDFSKVFNLGGDDKTIASVDEAGIALAAIQELRNKTEKLEELVKAQQQLITILINNKTDNNFEQNRETERGLKVFQNVPNPFQNDTKIEMEIPQSVISATLYIYDLQGKMVDQYIVRGRGTTSVLVQGGKLSPGLYLYTLIGDDQATPAKRMILTE
jgi:hypothetical protein